MGKVCDIGNSPTAEMLSC